MNANDCRPAERLAKAEKTPKDRAAAETWGQGSQRVLSAAPWPADSFRQFRAACKMYGPAKVAEALGYKSRAAVIAARDRKLPDTAALQARWEAASSKANIAQLKLEARTVTARGIRWKGQWLHAPALVDLLGMQVIVRGDGRGALLVFAGAILKPICALRPEVQPA